MNNTINKDLDLLIERKTSLKPKTIWDAWTKPVMIKKWLCPKPWKVVDCQLDLRIGGEFLMTMAGPNDESHSSSGCFLEIIPKEKLVWTNMMSKNYQPNPTVSLDFPFVASIYITKTNDGSIYQAKMQHATEEDRKKHEQMGFYEGWNTAFDQLIELSKESE